MDYDTLSRQARCKALGFDPGPLDGVDGPRTRAAAQAATRAQGEKGLPFIHQSDLTRIHLHWTAGTHKASGLDKTHYHTVVQGDGTVIRCNPPEKHLAHTLNANGGAIGVSACAMGGATERPFSPGQWPLNEIQIDAFCEAVAALCRTYDIPVTRWSVLMHSEVQPTLGIKQRQKWDLNWLPGMAAPADPIAAGDRLRARITAALA